MADNWGPWIEHNGKGCPCVGMVAEVVFAYDKLPMCYVVRGGASWFWLSPDIRGTSITRCGRLANPIVRYRIRKPRGMAILESILADVTEPAQEKAET